MRIKEDFEVIKEQIGIETIADHLLEKDGRLYKFPGERTGSIHIYEGSRSFYDFGRCVGGDVIKLWSHIRGCDNWTALQEIRETFGLSAPNRAYSRDLIRKQEEARRQQIEAKKQEKKRWRIEVDRLKAESSFYQAILEGEHCKPLSWTWCTCQNRLTVAQGLLDLLCGIY
ncbi:hypothetical protein DW740_00125 [Blautia obeum]|uniref:Zinc finger CHC2-type domain-containing protein n=1 Tax=Blautia obeum TaxID=40520 RepID=A0A414JB33_9FIRM|nr:hypothetical protein [Blautia obeum]RHE41764.1 hypothetical protein DW740_00125 [Blautia obeum]